MSDYILAPFSVGEVSILNRYQKCSFAHQYTCEYHDENLVATTAGLVCPRADCGYNQQWAHRSTASAECVDTLEKLSDEAR